MAEDLTEYLHENGLKVRYMHSDIDTLERIEIIRDLRMGVFDILVGINLLREGLDIPECALVAILDADKEGFLRSDRSLIQTIGRAARNIKGRCILYGDDVTGSMRRAIDETNRRRELQIAYNDENNIKPKGIKKDIREALDEDTYVDNDSLDKLQIVSNSKKKFTQVNSNNVTSIIIELEKEMYNHANNLEFEDAAKLRDQINELQEKYLMLPKAKS